MSSKFWIGAGFLAALTSLAPWALGNAQRVEKKIVVVNGSGGGSDSITDKLTIRDSDSLAIGETRDYTSPSGKGFTLTRDAEEHWTLRGEGREFGFGGAPEDLESSGDGQVTINDGKVMINKRVVVMDGHGEPGEAEIHTITGGDGDSKQVQVFVEKGGDGEPEVHKVLVNGREVDPDGENVRIILRKQEGGDASPQAGHHVVIETEDISGFAGVPDNATMVEILREGGTDQQKRVEKRVFLFVSGDDH